MTLSESVPADLQWRKSSHSTNGACIELAKFTDGDYAIRNSNRQHLGVLTCSREEMLAFVAGVRGEDFDDLLT